MIICMCKIICVTNRKLCKGDFVSRIQEIAREAPYAVILREKDLDEKDYAALAGRIMPVCRKYGVLCILHSHWDAALHLGAEGIHLPLPLLRKMPEEKKAAFRHIGASCHSLGEVMEAEKLGCTYLLAGHVFPTDCKAGVPPRGLSFLSDVCKKASVPVYAIGGMNPENFSSVTEAGAAGACIMSGFMECGDVSGYIKKFRALSTVL